MMPYNYEVGRFAGSDRFHQPGAKPSKPNRPYDIREPVGVRHDVRYLRSQRPVMLSANTGHSGLRSLDGQAYPVIGQKGLKEEFKSHYVPFTDGKLVLEDCEKKPMSQIGYGNVPKRHAPKVPKGNRPGIAMPDTITKHYENVAVYSDFPKGAGSEPQLTKLFRDGEYEKGIALASRTNVGEIPAETFAQLQARNPRWAELSLAGQVGATLFGEALARKEIEDYFNMEKKEFDKDVLRQLGYAEEEIQAKLKALERERAIQDLSRRFHLSEEGARAIVVKKLMPDEEMIYSGIQRGDADERTRRQGDIPVPSGEYQERPGYTLIRVGRERYYRPTPVLPFSAPYYPSERGRLASRSIPEVDEAERRRRALEKIRRIIRRRKGGY